MVNNLKLDELPQASQPSYLQEPITKTFGTSLQQGKTDPMKSILADSQKILEKYKLQSYSKSKEQQELPEVNTPRKQEISPSPEPNSIGRGIKRSRERKPDAIPEPIAVKTPIRNKPNFSSPSPKRHPSPSVLATKESTPVSFKVTNLNKQKFIKLSNREQAPEKPKTKKLSIRNELDVEDDSEYDNLACHADNILRMAVDSTMLGSFYNNSFSFSFSNIANEDSFLSARKRDDILNDDANNSLLGLHGKKLGLNKLRATKIEINEDDLRRAIDGI